MLNLSSLNKRIKIFSSLSWINKKLILEVLLYSAIARFVILIIPFRKYRKYLGRHNEETPLESDKEEHKTIKQVQWAITGVCSHTPWESKCLVQAIIAQKILKKRNIHSTLYLGVNKDRSNKILAHAWLRSGLIFVTGGYNKNEYVEVGRFAN